MQKDTHVLYDGKVTLVYDDDAHSYVIDGVPYPSVTSVLSVMDKPQLQHWRVSQVVKWIEMQWQPGQAYDADHIASILSRSIYAADRKASAAREIGSRVHLAAEAFFTAGERFDVSRERIETKNAVESLYAWIEDVKPESEHVERKICSLEHRYAGTADLIGRINDRLTVVDFKTSSRIFDDYYVQLAAYAVAYQEETGEKPDQIAVVRLPKDDSPYEFETRETWDEEWEVFRSCLKIKKWREK